MSRFAEINPRWPGGGADRGRTALTSLPTPPGAPGNALIALRTAPYGIRLTMPGGLEIEDRIVEWIANEPAASQNGQPLIIFGGTYPGP